MTTDELRAVMQAEFDSVRSELNNVEIGRRAEIKNEGETTRRHFDIMVEKVNDSVRLVAEVTAHHSTVLDDHDASPQKIETR